MGNLLEELGLTAREAERSHTRLPKSQRPPSADVAQSESAGLGANELSRTRLIPRPWA